MRFYHQANENEMEYIFLQYFRRPFVSTDFSFQITV